MNPTLREIVAAYLRGHGYDGLYHEPSECACLLDDLMPCASGSGCPDLDGCRPGYRVEMEDGHWGVSPRPEAATPDPDRADVDLAHSIGGHGGEEVEAS